MLKRRQLKKGGEGPQRPSQNKPQERPQQPQGRPQQNKPQQNRSQANSQNQQGTHAPSSRAGHRHHRPQQQVRRPAPPPPAYFQRSLILVAQGEVVKLIDEVRVKLDPLAKKFPTSITLLQPEPAVKLPTDFVKNFKKDELPTLNDIVFNSIHIQKDKYLWLSPSEEGAAKIRTWHENLMKSYAETNSTHTQDETFMPHITLGYIPRSKTADEILTFAKGIITLPLSLQFEKLILEEFSENQQSQIIETISL